MTRAHPWRLLRQMPHLIVHWCHLPDGQVGCTDGTNIWLDRRQRQAQRRSTLAHELEHIERGHDECQVGAVEMTVEIAAARKLIPLVALAEAIVWSQDEHELAEDLWVDVAMVRTRLMSLSDEEHAYVEDVLARREAAL